MRLGSLLAALSLIGLVALPGVTEAAPPTASLTLTATQAYAGSDSTLRVTATTGDGDPLADAALTLERRTDGTWRKVAELTTDGQGRATDKVKVWKDPADNVVRVTYSDPDAGKATATKTLPLKKRVGVLSLTGPGKVVDERSATLTVRWRTGAGDPVAG